MFYKVQVSIKGRDHFHLQSLGKLNRKVLICQNQVFLDYFYTTFIFIKIGALCFVKKQLVNNWDESRTALELNVARSHKSKIY